MESQCYQKVIRLSHSPWLCLVTFLKLKTETKNLIKSLFSVNSLTCQKICAVREKSFWHQPKMITFCGNLCEKKSEHFYYLLSSFTNLLLSNKILETTVFYLVCIFSFTDQISSCFLMYFPLR